MMRGCGRVRGFNAVAPSALALATQVRGIKYSTINDTLKPTPGQTAGTLNVMNEICINPETDEERKRPAWRNEVSPKAEEKTYLSTMWKWGHNSLTLFKKVNEDAGPWWNANNTGLTSNWSQIGEYCNGGLWSGIWRYTYGVGHFNLKPGQIHGKTFANGKSKNGEIRIDYKETTKDAPQRSQFPHTEEHVRHRRISQPKNGNTVMDSVHAKRVLREVQYQLGQGLRYYMIDGVFGSHPATSTPYRIFTDNPDSAYFASMSAIRNRNIVAQEELVLLKRVKDIPLDEWSWRRPGVLVLHCPSYDFEIPRIVEEFGGPRPQDLGLSTPRFTVTDPYSIPMKSLIGAEPSCDHLLKQTAMLSARWGYYADDKNLLTVGGDSVLSPDGSHLTIFLGNGRVDTSAIKSSPQLYGAHHHRIANGIVSRGWDSTSFKESASKPQSGDIVEESLQTTQRPLPTHIGQVDGTKYRSHRFFKNRRHIADFGFKMKHKYTEDAAENAYSAGLLFKAPKKTTQSIPRPAAFHLKSVTLVVVNGGDGGLEKVADAKKAAKMVVDGIAHDQWLYAEEAPLAESLAEALGASAGVMSVGEKSAAAVVDKLAKNGKL